MIEYQIGEAAENPQDAVINKTGFVQKFTLREVENSILLNKKSLKEIEGRITLDSAKMTNIEQNHAFVLDMSEQDLFTCHMYMEAKATVRVCNKKATELRTAIEEDILEVAEIVKQLPELGIVPSPEEFTKPAEEVEKGTAEEDEINKESK